MIITYFVHGTTTDNEKGLATGWAHGKLSAKGVEQARMLNEQAGYPQFDVVFCSDLQRAIDSASFAFGNTCKIIQDSRIREANYGDFTEQPSKAFKADAKKFIDKPFPNGESYRDVEARMRDFLAFLKAGYDGQNVGIVAHQAPQLALEVIVNGRSWAEAIDEDWRHSKAWQPGWTFKID